MHVSDTCHQSPAVEKSVCTSVNARAHTHTLSHTASAAAHVCNSILAVSIYQQPTTVVSDSLKITNEDGEQTCVCMWVCQCVSVCGRSLWVSGSGFECWTHADGLALVLDDCGENQRTKPMWQNCCRCRTGRQQLICSCVCKYSHMYSYLLFTVIYFQCFVLLFHRLQLEFLTKILEALIGPSILTIFFYSIIRGLIFNKPFNTEKMFSVWTQEVHNNFLSFS